MILGQLKMGEHEANIYMYDILEPAKKNRPVCALVSGKQSVWGLVLGAAEQTVLQIF